MRRIYEKIDVYYEKKCDEIIATVRNAFVDLEMKKTPKAHRMCEKVIGKAYDDLTLMKEIAENLDNSFVRFEVNATLDKIGEFKIMLFTDELYRLG